MTRCWKAGKVKNRTIGLRSSQVRITHEHDMISIKHLGELAGCILREGEKLRQKEDFFTNR